MYIGRFLSNAFSHPSVLFPQPDIVSWYLSKASSTILTNSPRAGATAGLKTGLGPAPVSPDLTDEGIPAWCVWETTADVAGGALGSVLMCPKGQPALLVVLPKASALLGLEGHNYVYSEPVSSLREKLPSPSGVGKGFSKVQSLLARFSGLLGE